VFSKDMGLQVKCRARYGELASSGSAKLESERLIFHGDFRLTLAFKDLTSVEAKDGELWVRFPGGAAAFELGTHAEKWATKIRNPKGLLDKLGVKAEHQVSLLGIADESFCKQLKERTNKVTTGQPKAGSDIIFLAASAKEDLKKLGSLQGRLKKNGALWVVWPKGKPELREDDIRSAAGEAGLVDVKVVKFSESHSALKLVIPVARR
jgi:hypothetical protein